MPSDKDKLMYWLQKDITDKKCVMEEIIDIYAQIHDLLEKDAIEFKYDFHIILMKLSAYLYQNSL
jgi:hypothetical protein|tara:strand:- start:284 stop:478 length:195 start_codon:yes stop_codon:yes gene_type:complete